MFFISFHLMGNRIAKHIFTDNAFTLLEKSTYYVRDASGNVMAVYDRIIDASEETSEFMLSERHIYGSSRIGMDVSTHVFGPDPYTSLTETTRELGHKQYEISNHLGNVLSVITDQKLPVVDATVVVSYSAVVVTATDYSPFGVGLYGRSWSGGYRYGFNGKEEVAIFEGSYDFGTRIYVGSLARSFSLDPKIALTSFQGGYSFFSDNPIYFIDKDGEIIQVATESSRASYNTAILSVFAGNDAAVAALSISADVMSVKPISQQDYNNIIQSLNSPDQQAAFRGLYLASQSKATYLVQVIEGDEKAFLNGEAVTVDDLKQADGVNFMRDDTNSDISDALVYEIAISKEEAGERKDIYLAYDVVRSESAMVLGSIITTFLHNDPLAKNENFLRPMENCATLTGVQNENIIMRASGMGEMSGNNFLKPDKSPLTDLEKQKCSEIPEQLRYLYEHSSRGVEEVRTLPADQ
jgi:hypothetical protein